MLNRTLPELIFIRTCIAALQSIPLLSTIYTLSRWTILPGRFRLPLALSGYLFAEALFFTAVYIPRKLLLQKPAQHPPLTTRADRQSLFKKCIDETPDVDAYLSGWFHGAPAASIKRENVREFLNWAFLNASASGGAEEFAEVEGYITLLESQLGRVFESGYNKDVKCVRLTVDGVVMEYRSLLWYSIVYLVDLSTCVRLRWHSFRHFTPGAWFRVLPPRPHTLFSARSPARHISYWQRPHTHPTKLPIVFIHGIGIGLYPYIPFLNDLASLDPTVGILVLELMPISFRFSHTPLSKSAFTAEFTEILSRHEIQNFILISHSYGTVLSTWLLHSESISPRISSLVLMDPVTLLLHLPSVAYNFVHRAPSSANEWQLQYFASRDPDVAHSLSRHFFWAENILWKEELAGKKVAVVISENDLIVDTPECWRYLTGRKRSKGETGNVVWTGEVGDLVVLWYDGLDHAQVFDTWGRRKIVVAIVEEFLGV
ncbi:hypothetical protein L873DRAFT_1672183 [Choiromyces venosus 120613-1]|uniref:AB hydrolase-1 domain-containing protein n=1 Tax=Choiromyces venosus 120613-1 TaxID=1336337 RepID=A0A3N4JWX6_9PEZI|nr:hypothetical protein L873DRAFT_1672183 [Choiromyces venosus 120613-1]